MRKNKLRKKNYVHNMKKGLIKLLIICLVCIIPAVILIVSCKLDTVIVEGSSHYSEDELKGKLLTKKTDGNTILLYLRYQYGNVESIPFVEHIDMDLVDKNTVKIQVYEKVITGCIKFMGHYMYFDKDGIVVESSDEKLDKVPIITGLSFNQIILHEKLEVQNDSLFQIILNITQLIHKYELQIESINFNSNLEVTLESGNIEILLGKRETYDEQIAELKNILPKADNKSIILDMKSFIKGQNQIIAKPKK